MAIFDQSIDIEATPSSVSEAIKASTSPSDQLIISRPDTLLIALRQSMGYVYLLRPQGDGTRLRLMVDSAQAVREAFRGKSPKEALTILATPATPSDQQTSIANDHLATIKKSAEKPVRLSSSAAQFGFTPTDYGPPSNDILAPLPSGGDPNISALFDKKPLPTDGGTTRLPAGTPWNPDRLSGWAVFFAPASGIAMALNWPRLGKPQWMWPTIIASILIPVAAIGIAIGLVAISPKTALTLLPLILLLISINWGFIWFVRTLQRGAYKKWDSTGSVSELLSHHYNFTDAGIAGAVVVLIFLVIGIATIYFTGRPNTFDSPEVAITYPSVWRTIDSTTFKNCSLKKYHCILALTDARYGFTTIILMKVTYPVTMTPETAEKTTWDGLVTNSNNAGLRLAGREPTTIAGVPAYLHSYYFPSTSHPGETQYGKQFYFVKDKTLYELHVYSISQPIFDERWSDSQQFMAGIRLK